MDTKITYFDETGDDGNKSTSSSTFILTSYTMSCNDWQENFNIMKLGRQRLKEQYGFHTSQEMHTKHFLSDKSPYREYGWTLETRIKILVDYIDMITNLKGNAINVIIDKSNIKNKANYDILGTALTYNIQRIENASHGDWHYLLVTDEGRIGPMRKTARKIRSFNPVPSRFSYSSQNKPIKHMIEDIFEKNSAESYFIQNCDFISYFVHLYYKTHILNEPLPNRVSQLIDLDFIKNTMNRFKEAKVFNLQANHSNEYGLVIYPKKQDTSYDTFMLSPVRL